MTGSGGITAEDHIAIERLMYCYARCADHKDYLGLAQVFSSDAVFENRERTVTSLTAIQDMMLALEKYRSTQHRVQNILYAVDGDTAQGETYCLASHLIDQDGETRKIDMGIIYRDRLRRTSDGWRIAQRKFDLLWSQTTAVD